MEYDKAIGLIETRGIVPLTAAIEAMLKTADVQCISVERISSGYFATAIQGTVAAVRQAVDAGEAAVRQYGELRSSQVYPKPHEMSTNVLANETRAALNAGDISSAISESSS